MAAEPSLFAGREPTPYATTFPCESCHLLGGEGKTAPTLLQVYGRRSTTRVTDHRGWRGHEIATYRHILAHSTSFRSEILRRLHGFRNGPILALFEYLGWQPAGRKLNDPGDWRRQPDGLPTSMSAVNAS